MRLSKYAFCKVTDTSKGMSTVVNGREEVGAPVMRPLELGVQVSSLPKSPQGQISIGSGSTDNPTLAGQLWQRGKNSTRLS